MLHNQLLNLHSVLSGQKCSACSRAVIHEDVYDQVVDRVEELTKELTVGDPDAEDINFTGPVIDQASFDKIMSYIEIGKEEGRLVCRWNRRRF